MKKVVILFHLLFLVIATSSVFGQSANDAVLALKKLQVKVETGISYQDYAPALADAKFPVKLFLEGSESKNDVSLSSALQKAIEHYEFANRVWNVKFSCGTSVTNSMYPGCDQDIFYKIKFDYPSVPIRKTFGQESLSIDFAVLMIWNKAKEEVQIASDLLSKAELKAQSMKAENEDLKKENVALRKELETLNVKLADLQRENAKIKKETESLTNENANLKKEIDSLRNKATTPRRKK